MDEMLTGSDAHKIQLLINFSVNRRLCLKVLPSMAKVKLISAPMTMFAQPEPNLKIAFNIFLQYCYIYSKRQLKSSFHCPMSVF